MTDYYQKYLKYKQKYLDLREQIGGEDCGPGRIDCNGKCLDSKKYVRENKTCKLKEHQQCNKQIFGSQCKNGMTCKPSSKNPSIFTCQV